MTLLAFFFLPNVVSAHVLKTDGPIGAVMHVDPDDDPVAGRQSNFYFEFKDKNNVFKPIDCDCTFSIIQNGKTLISQPLFQNSTDPSLTNASASYYFPDKGVYVIRITGQPKVNQSFAPFTLDYDVRVARTNSTPEQATQSNWFTEHLPQLIGGAIGVVLLGIIILKSERKKERR